MSKGIIGAGNWILDKVKTLDRWPQEGELCNILKETVSCGGGPCNVLFDIAAMGKDIPLFAVGIIGEDSDGEFLMSQIRRHNIDARFMRRDPDVSTSFTDVMSVPSTGRRTFFHNRGANALLDYPHIQAVDAPARIFYLGYLLLLDKLDQVDAEYGSAAARALAMMQEKGCRTVVDIVSEEPAKFQRIVPPALKYTDCLIINEIEAGNCLGKEVRLPDNTLDGNALKEAAHFLLQRGVRELVVIHFPEGAFAITADGDECYVPSCHLEPRQIVGSVGAGDAFCAGVVYGLHENFPIEESLRLGSACAYFNLLSPTATEGAPSFDQLMEHLATCEFNPIPEGLDS